MYYFDAKMHFMLFKPVGMKETLIRCCEDLGRNCMRNMES